MAGVDWSGGHMHKGRRRTNRITVMTSNGDYRGGRYSATAKETDSLITGDAVAADYSNQQQGADDERFSANNNFNNNGRMSVTSLFKDFFDSGDRMPPLEPNDKPRQTGTSSRQTFFLLCKAFIGTGILFLPRAFLNGGILFSSITMALIAFFALVCMLLLVECKEVYGGGFGSIAFRAFGEPARVTVQTFIVISQLGFCCAYLVFVSDNLKGVVDHLSNCTNTLPREFYLFIQLAIYIPLAMVRKIKYFAIPAIVADVFIIAGFIYIYQFDIRGLVNQDVPLPPIKLFNEDKFALFIGTAVFAFEGIGLILPIEEAMKSRKKFPLLLSLLTIVMVVLYVSIGALTYGVLGDNVATIVLENLDENDPIVIIVRILYCLAVMITFPLMFFPAFTILEHEFSMSPRFGRFFGGGDNSFWTTNLARALVVCLLSAIAYGGASNLDNFVSIIGGICCVPLSFIFPTLFHFKLLARSPFEKIRNGFLFLFGCFAMVYVTYNCIASWTVVEPADVCKK